MARVWVYDRTKQKHRAAVDKANAVGRKPPARWGVMYYDRAGKLKSEVAPTKLRADERRAELESALSAGTCIDPDSVKVNCGDMAEKWLESRHDLKPPT
jgi:hypothetical protein